MCGDGNLMGATPVILLSRARSGSTVTCELLAKAVNSTAAMLENEPFEAFFGFDYRNETGSSLVSRAKELLCRRSQRNTGFVGFKWKPYHGEKPVFDHLWRWTAIKRIRVVFLQRNPLDVALHEMKHARVPGYDACQASRGSASCVQLRRRATLAVDVPRLVEHVALLSAQDMSMFRASTGSEPVLLSSSEP
mgnify:CR=1 FL=1